MMPNSYSQFGEDLLVYEILADIGTNNQWCFEIGAHDGRFYSNTLGLREQGWQAVLIESSDRHFAELDRDFGSQSLCIHETVTDLDAVLRRAGAPKDIDFGVIDIDGQDYWLWHDLVEYRPRILLIEFSPYTEQVNYDPVNPVPRGLPGQTSKQPILDLAKEKGYRFYADTFCNILLVAEH